MKISLVRNKYELTQENVYRVKYSIYLINNYILFCKNNINSAYNSKVISLLWKKYEQNINKF